MIRKPIFILFLFVFLKGFSQDQQDEILFTIDEEPTAVSEFVRVYKKNLDLVKDDSQKDVDEYLKLFINYKLKLKEAYALELDEKPSYQRELANYRKQLATNFLSDTKVTEELVKQAYERTFNEVNVSHILVMMDQNASPTDTLNAYEQITRLRERAISEGFEKVQKEVHNGKSLIGEDLGYFTAFKVVYDFENVAYDTPVGEISQPFKTRFGYHILKVNDKRKSRGRVQVGHIMVSLQKEGQSDASAEERIQDLYKKIQQGEDFETLATQFSDDKSSSSKGGLMEPFASGQLRTTQFEDQAFALQSTGDVSVPFKTEFGWHMVKLYHKFPVKSFEELKPELEVSVKRDVRSLLINESLVNDLKDKYNMHDTPVDLSYFVSIMNDTYFARNWSLPANFDGTKPLVNIQDKQLTYSDFGNYLVLGQRRIIERQPFEKLINDQYESFIGNELKQYQEDNLEFENKEFAQIVGEYRDGLLLFDLMESKIWNVLQTDSVEIRDFYEKNKKNYKWNERAEVVVANCSSKKDAKEVGKLLKQGKSQDEIKQKLNTEGKVKVIFTTGTMEEGDAALPKEYKLKQGQSDVLNHNDSYTIVMVKKIMPETLKSFDEAKGLILSDYQNHKEQQWLESLKKKYHISVDQAVLNKVKTDLKS